MAKDTSYRYYDLAKPILPYKSYTSPVDESPHFVTGSQNIMASQIGYLEKRPGFGSAAEGTPTTLSGTIKRIFSWRKWDGTFILMACSVSGSNARVYSLIGASFVLIWTSTSNVPFDFVVSNNFVYFGNGTDMKKYDGTTVSKWGCDSPPSAPLVTLQTGTLPPGMSFSGSTLSGTPTSIGATQITFTATDSAGVTATKTFNFSVIPAELTITTGSYLTEVISGSAMSQNLNANYGTPTYTWSLFSGTLPPGTTLSGGGILSGTPSAAGTYTFAAKVTDSLAATDTKAFNIVVQSSTPLTLTPTTLPSVIVGNSYPAQVLTAGGGTGPYTFQVIPSTGTINDDPTFNNFPQGFSATPSATDITIASPNPSIPGVFAFRIVVVDSLGAVGVQDYTLTVDPDILTITNITIDQGHQGFSYGDTLFVRGGVGPYTFTYTVGSLDAQTGYIYGYTYTTVYGHESNMSELSITTGIFTSEDPAVTMIASSDPQVNHINLYRTTDGGVPDPGVMRLVTTLSNTNQTYVDSAPDTSLGSQTGPGFLINTPPTPSRGFRWSNGRIYGQNNATTYYSGLEEVSNGIPEEAWPSGIDGNYYNWPATVGGMAVTENGVDVGLSEQFWQISGDSLDTFRKSLLLDKAGVGSPTCITSVGNEVLWFDSAKQIWASSLGEIGEPIRTDIAFASPSTTYIGYHKFGNFNWIYLLDANAGKLYIFDLDTDQWYPPWTVSASAIWSGETSPGVIRLFVAINGTVYFMNTNPMNWMDAGQTYEDDIKTNLIPISPGRTTTGRSKMEPTQLEEIMFEMAADTAGNVVQFPALVGQLGDDDPVRAQFIDWINLSANNVTPQYVPQGKYLIQYRFIADSVTTPALRSAFWIQFAPLNWPWKLYSFTISWIST